MGIREYLNTIKDELKKLNKQSKNLKVKTILHKCGYLRRNHIFVNSFNSTLDELGLCTNPKFDMYLPHESRVSISIKGASESRKEIDITIGQNNIKHNKKLEVEHDFFYYLFDWPSDQEYAMFQACLDSNTPVGIFLLPKEEDFFSAIVEKILIYELVRKKQYIGENTQLIASSLEFNGVLRSDEEKVSSYEQSWSSSNIFHFNQSTVSNAILGSTGVELLDSEKFDGQFDQLSLYTNKYCSSQIFILFHCPSEAEIYAHQKQDILGYLVDKVSSKLPFVFTLRCKYANDKVIKEKEILYAHLRLLLEVPMYEIDDNDISILDYFLELQKVQVQAESQLLIKMKPEHFTTLRWGNESNEHIYLKYFAIKTLEDMGYELSQIICEQTVTSDEGPSIKKRPDVCVRNKVIIEIETLRDKEYLDLVYNTLAKIVGWPKGVENVWLVLPGFEIARNYYQLKKVREILEQSLVKKYCNSVQFSIMTPDYENHQLVPVSFDSIDYPTFNPPPFGGKPPAVPPLSNQVKINFNSIKGLRAEKEKLNTLLKLQLKGFKSGIDGILFFGLPGCGKTLLANAFANESGRYFFNFSPADIKSIWIGQSQKNIKDIFRQARKKSPSVLFIDELDSIGFSRDEFQAHTDQKATVNQLLIELNNVGDDNVIVIAATNYFSTIDPALKRSGRLDWKIPIFPPDKFERAELFHHYLSLVSAELFHHYPSLVSTEISPFNYEELGDRSAKFTPSDIALVCKEIRNAVLLDQIHLELTTLDVICYIDNAKDGGLTLNKDQVEQFLDECKTMSIRSSKLETLEHEWND